MEKGSKKEEKKKRKKRGGGGREGKRGLRGQNRSLPTLCISMSRTPTR